MPDWEQNYALFKQLKPLNELDKTDLNYLNEHSELLQLDPRTLVSAERGFLMYLLEGEVSLLSGGFVTEKFTHLEQRALSPLFNEYLEEDSAVLTSYGAILKVDRELFEGLYNQLQAASIESSEIGLSTAENELMQSLLQAFNQKKLDLPGLPEAALNIRRAVNNPDVGSTEIIQIVQTDPVLSARLVKVANSPLYGTWREIKTVRDAVRRLGLETTKNLSFSLSVKQLFRAKSSLIKEHIHRVYAESTSIAAIAYVIAQNQATHLDPEQALLCGLIQNLGLIPILKYVDEHPSMMQTIEMLGKSIESLQLPVSALIFNEWNFDPGFLQIVEEAENWQRDTGEDADYCDVLIAARLLFRQKQSEYSDQDIDHLPVILKLKLLKYDDDGHYFMDKAEHEINAVQKLLHSA